MSIKTRSAAKKRFKITGSGKIMCKSGYKRHGMTAKNKRMLRQTRGNKLISTMEALVVKRILGNCKGLKLNKA